MIRIRVILRFLSWFAGRKYHTYCANEKRRCRDLYASHGVLSSVNIIIKASYHLIYHKSSFSGQGSAPKRKKDTQRRVLFYWVKMSVISLRSCFAGNRSACIGGAQAEKFKWLLVTSAQVYCDMYSPR